MGKTSKLIEKILTGKADTNIKFKELCSLLLKLGFNCRVKGSHQRLLSKKAWMKLLIFKKILVLRNPIK